MINDGRPYICFHKNNIAIFTNISLMLCVIFSLFCNIFSFYFAKKTKSASAYFAAGGNIHWSVNGIAFAGDYLSAASFLGICGMIAVVGYDGFLYSIGYLAGWIVALFIVAEPMKRLGKYTFTDALDAKFNNKGIQLAAAISTLVVSLFYLIPQMVGAGVLVTPLLGLPHWVGVLMVGAIVIIIVATAGMTSTTYVQFIKGALLVIFSTIIVGAVCYRGLSTEPDEGGTVDFYKYKTLEVNQVTSFGYTVSDKKEISGKLFYKLSKDKKDSWWYLTQKDGVSILEEGQYLKVKENGGKIINGSPSSKTNQLRQIGNMMKINGKTGIEAKTGPLGVFSFLSNISSKDSIIKRWGNVSFPEGKSKVTVFYPMYNTGNEIMRPGQMFKVTGTPLQKLDFISLMLALFFGTAALPHILIR